ncbi:MAG TPA: hypothetical protein VF530_20670 [Planctomycetota bacterium]
MTRAKVRLVAASAFALAAGLLVHAEDYKCTQEAGCTAQINEDGELEEVTFRKGDLVSTEDGWVVSQDDGWVKVKKKPGGGS